MSLLQDNSQKTPLSQSLHKFGAQKAQDAVAALGKGLPCTVAKVDGPGIVTVNFAVAQTPPLPQVQMPVVKFPYIQYPIQVGDPGVALSADLRTGGLTGLGKGVPNLYDTAGNLAAMAFFPLGVLSEAAVDPEALVMYGNIIASPDALGFFATPKVAKQTLAAAASDLPTVITLANSIRDALIAYGLAE